MLIRKSLVVSVGLIYFFLGQTSNAWMVEHKRCPNWGDNVSAANMNGRWEWAIKCDPTLKLYHDTNPRSLPGRTTTMPDGATASVYPVFGVYMGTDNQGKEIYSNPNNYFAPVDPNAPCNLPPKYEFSFLCVQGCYAPDQRILLGDGYAMIGAFDFSIRAEKEGIMSFKIDESLAAETKLKSVDYMTSSVQQEMNTLVILETASGNHLKVTEEHPLINGEGRVVQARTLKVGDTLLGINGVEFITSLSKENHFGKVYNLAVDTEQLDEKVVVAEGIYSADVTYQNENTRYLDQIIFRLKGIRTSDL